MLLTGASNMHDHLRRMRVLEEIRIEALKCAVELTINSMPSSTLLKDHTDIVLDRAKEFEDYILVITK